MIKTILFAFALLPLLVSAAPAWQGTQDTADWYDSRPDERAEALKQYSYRPPSDDSDCFTVEHVWYCP